ncbi:MAG: hypothetical protein JRD89_04330 [Deltaproteobacteria bacterium]|nr:hypothetical protein [Deltaproteobacteria bacterium]
MRSEKEVRTLREEIEKMNDFISDYGTDKDFEAITYACDVCDALSWVLGEITTEQFLSDSYLDMENLKGLIRNIEKRTGKKIDLQ